MDLKILGCSGGIGGTGLRTTSLLLEAQTLLDAGTGVGDLDIQAMARIDRVFLTHAHLDHVACLPLMLDSTFGMREEPVQVFAPAEVINILKKHLFNWTIWPDFSVIPSAEAPCFRFVPFEVGEVIPCDGFAIRALPVDHHVPAVAYELVTDRGSTVFSGDTRGSSLLKETIAQIPRLHALIAECAFPDQEKSLAERAGHFCPATLAEWLPGLCPEQLYITHLKPQFAAQTMAQINQHLKAFPSRISRLESGMVIPV